MPTVDSTTPFKRDVLGRVTLPAAQREALLDEFERSGMKKDAKKRKKDAMHYVGLSEV